MSRKPGIGINRNILECKVVIQEFQKQFSLVLIETYWNVKMKEAAEGTTDSVGINRNILECKEAHRKRH